MKQLVHIHGGETWHTYADYLTFLNEYQIDDPALPLRHKWREQYAEFLGTEWQIIAPRMPNYRNAKYNEWKIWFEKHMPYLHDGVVCVGSSLGASFFAKYLSENTLPVRIGQLHLVAGRFFPPDEDFSIDAALLPHIETQCDRISIYHSEDDFVVPFEDCHAFKAGLTSAELITFKDRGHFLQPEFPELMESIKNG